MVMRLMDCLCLAATRAPIVEHIAKPNEEGYVSMHRLSWLLMLVLLFLRMDHCPLFLLFAHVDLCYPVRQYPQFLLR